MFTNIDIYRFLVIFIEFLDI